MNNTELTTIPGSFTSDATRRIRWIKVADDLIAGSPARIYEATLDDGTLKAILAHDEVEPGKFLWHLSVSHRDKADKPDRVPTWDELKHSKYMLLPRDVDVCMVLIFPRKKAPYVNHHNTCLHLWETSGEIGL